MLPEVPDLLQAVSEVEACLERCLLSDQPMLRSSWRKLQRRAAESKPCDRDAARLRAMLEQSMHSVQLRQTADMQLSYPASLPVASCEPEISAAIAAHPVTIIAGETGSGKTTQIPKMCLAQGRGLLGQIGHTQPRRLAARTVADRIASELEVELGSTVGYQFRFSDKTSASTRVKLMTDGLLLAQIASDRQLLQYDTLIIDEAHERSLNIDFLLGYLKLLLEKRDDLKVVITSATIDVARFASHFGDAPVIEVPGRSYPVSLEYREWDNAASQEASAPDWCGQVEQVLAEIECEDPVGRKGGPKDVLVFLPGEREIRDLSKHLRGQASTLDVVPLYARLSQAEQRRVFTTRAAGSASRRVILATNVAETSVTVPGIGYVVDPGLARISRYSARSKLQRLPVEAISQASARQRAGRCGRIAPGVCYRLYSEADCESRPAHTEPELLRTNLAAVILQMKALNLGSIKRFPFLDRPDERQVRSGLKTLEELGALERDGQLNTMGRQLSRLPVDPRLGRMLLAACQHHCLADVLVIVSAMAVQDPREMPADKRQAAEQMHRRFWHKRSDFLAWLGLWDYLETQRQSLSDSQFRKLCKKEFIAYMRVREWREVHRQLSLVMREIAEGRADNTLQRALPAAVPTPGVEPMATSALAATVSAAEYEQIHCALLSGLASNIGVRQRKSEYLGARNLKFNIFPGSSQFKPAPRWLLAGEIVETRKVYARAVAAIEPHWVIRELAHLVKHSYHEPHWDTGRGQVVAYRSSQLYGINLATRQRVDYQKVDPEVTHQVFVEEALVARALQPDARLASLAGFYAHNNALIDEVRRLEEKVRRRDLLVDESVVSAFYRERLPAEASSRNALAAWLRTAPADQVAGLALQREQVLMVDPGEVLGQFPDHLQLQGHEIALDYCFLPGDERDGVTARIPLGLLSALPGYAFDWLVPGLLRDKCIELIKSLAKPLRRQLVPVPMVVDRLLERLQYAQAVEQNRMLVDALAEQINIFHSLALDPVEWRQSAEPALDDFYRMRFVIIDASGEVVDQGRDFFALQQRCQSTLQQSVADYDQARFRQRGLSDWSFGELPASHDYQHEGVSISGFPVLVDNGDTVDLALETSAAAALVQTRRGVVRLLRLALREPVRYLRKNLCRREALLLPYVRWGNRELLVEDLVDAAIYDCALRDGLPTDRPGYERCLAQCRSALVARATDAERHLYSVLEEYQQLVGHLERRRPHFATQCADIDAQLERLLAAGFMYRSGLDRLAELPRYLRAVSIRLDRLSGGGERDREYCEKLSSLEQPLLDLLYKYPEALFSDEAVSRFRWLIEELRVSLFAQQLKTNEPVSFQRVAKAWNQISLTQYPNLHRPEQAG